MSKRLNEKCIRIAMRNGDDTKVKVSFFGGAFSPEEFTSLFMAMLESYTTGLLETNSKEAVYNHFNKVFGIYLNKLIPDEEIYKNSKFHSDFKEITDATLGQPNDAENQKATEENRFAAYLLARDILLEEIGLDEESADVILNKRLKTYETLKSPAHTEGGEGIGEKKIE